MRFIPALYSLFSLGRRSKRQSSGDYNTMHVTERSEHGFKGIWPTGRWWTRWLMLRFLLLLSLGCSDAAVAAGLQGHRRVEQGSCLER